MTGRAGAKVVIRGSLRRWLLGTHAWYIKNRERVIARAKINQRKLLDESKMDPLLATVLRRGWQMKKLRTKIRAIRVLGGACKICGERDMRVLQVDHIIPVSKNHEKRQWGAQRFRVAAKNPRAYQVLCANCHMKKTWTANWPPIEEIFARMNLAETRSART